MEHLPVSSPVLGHPSSVLLPFAHPYSFRGNIQKSDFYSACQSPFHTQATLLHQSKINNPQSEILPIGSSLCSSRTNPQLSFPNPQCSLFVSHSFFFRGTNHVPASPSLFQRLSPPAPGLLGFFGDSPFNFLPSNPVSRHPSPVTPGLLADRF